MDSFAVQPGGLMKALQMDTVITKWDFGKFERTDYPYPTKCHVLSEFDRQKTHTHPIFRNLHPISS